MICEKCKKDKSDTMRRDGRDFPKSEEMSPNPALCTACCSQYKGREWMRGDK